MSDFEPLYEMTSDEYKHIRNIFIDNNDYVNNNAVITDRIEKTNIHPVNSKQAPEVIYCLQDVTNNCFKIGMTELKPEHFNDDSFTFFNADVNTRMIDYEKLYASRDESTGLITGGAGMQSYADNFGGKISSDDDNYIRNDDNSNPQVTTAMAAGVDRIQKELGQGNKNNYVVQWCYILMFKNKNDGRLFTFYDKYVHKIMSQHGFNENNADNSTKEFFDYKNASKPIESINEVRDILSSIANGTENVNNNAGITLRYRQIEAVCKLAHSLGWNNASMHNSVENNNDIPIVRNLMLAAVMRFGKTITSYALCRLMGFKHVLICSHRTNTEKNWRNDAYITDMAGFISKITNPDDFETMMNEQYYSNQPCIVYISIESLRNGQYDYITNKTWDIIIIDEAHEGIETELAVNSIFKPLILSAYKNGIPLNLLKITGTPFTYGLKTHNHDDKNVAIFNDLRDKMDSLLTMSDDGKSMSNDGNASSDDNSSDDDIMNVYKMLSWVWEDDAYKYDMFNENSDRKAYDKIKIMSER